MYSHAAKVDGGYLDIWPKRHVCFDSISETPYGHEIGYFPLRNHAHLCTRYVNMFIGDQDLS